MARFTDLTGKKFGRLTVVSRADTKGGSARWNCVCECGGEKLVYSSSLNSGRTTSCGCYMREVAREKRTHGSYSNPEYTNWVGMMQRCTNPNASHYPAYGGRENNPVTVCERWKDFSNFLTDMGPRPSSSHSIDRIDNNKGYSPDNCRWASVQEQARNKRPRTKSGMRGVYQQANSWVVQINTDGVRHYLGSFVTLEDAVVARKAAEEKYWNK